MNKKTCNVCQNRDKCKTLCDDMLDVLKNYKSKNKIYADGTFNTYNCKIDNASSVYTYGLSNDEKRDVKRIIVAILTKEQKKILSLYSEGYTQKDIAKILKVSQSNVSQKLQSIKSEINKSLIAVIPYVI